MHVTIVKLTAILDGRGFAEHQSWWSWSVKMLIMVYLDQISFLFILQFPATGMQKGDEAI